MSIKTHIVALSGYAGTGKDTIADLLVTHVNFRKLAFADALRGEVASGYDIDITYLIDPTTKNSPLEALALRNAPGEFQDAVLLSLQDVPPSINGWLDQPRTPRQILQWWGTEYRRRHQDDYWTSRVVDRLTYYIRQGECRFVITDCRFPNEADAVHTMGGVIWQVTRPGVDAASTPEGKHSSAVDGSAFKPAAVITNSHDIAHLQQLVLAEFFANEAGLDRSQVKVTAPQIIGATTHA